MLLYMKKKANHNYKLFVQKDKKIIANINIYIKQYRGVPSSGAYAHTS